MTVITGDSGVGKSTVLEASQAARRTAGTAAPPPRTVRHAAGALQFGFLEALADGVAQVVATRGVADQAVGYLDAAGRAFAQDKGKELGKVVAREIAAFVKGRLGPDAGKAFIDYLATVREAVDDRLDARISSAADRGVLELLIGFADEATRTFDCDFCLALDCAERLRDEDLRLLADLAETIPPRVRVVLAFATYTADHAATIEALRVAGVAEVPVTGLDRAGIEAWLLEAGLDAELADDVLRATGGYALHVGDLIAHLSAGGVVTDAPLNEQFAARTRQAWAGLERDVARLARVFSVLADPLPRSALCELSGLDEAGLGELEDRLERARIFSVSVNGQPWFHEQRRRFLLETILSADERDAAYANAADVAWKLARKTDDLRLLPQVAELVVNAPRLLGASEQLAACATLTVDELALGAALIELVEPNGRPLVEVSPLLRYANAVFEAPGDDLVDSLQLFATRGLVHLAVNEHAGAVVPHWEDPLVQAVIAGRAALELKRLPVPRVASELFFEMQQRFGAFEKAHYGMGRPSAAHLAETTTELRRPDSELVLIGKPESRDSLMVRGRFAGRPFYAGVTFAEVQQRDAALESVAGLDVDVLGERFQIDVARQHPTQVISSRRFLEAAERATGVSLGTPRPATAAGISLRLTEPIAPVEALQRKAAAVEALRDRMSESERFANGLDEPTGFMYYVEGDLMVEVEVAGGREGVTRLPDAPPWHDSDPYNDYRVEQALVLENGERARYRQIVGGRDPIVTDPVVDMLALLFSRTSSFNQTQTPRTIELDERSLAHLLEEANRRRFTDAVALAPLLGRNPPRPRLTRMVGYLDAPVPGLVPGGYSLMHVEIGPGTSDEDVLQFAMVPRTPNRDPPASDEVLLRRYGSVPQGWEPEIIVRGGLRSGVATMLGHTDTELRFKHPAEPHVVV